MSFVIFKAGRTIGPFEQESVAEMLARGEVTGSDLAQENGIEVWVPLRRFFPEPSEPARLEIARDFVCKWAAKFWAALHLYPIRVGLASLLFCCVLIVLPRTSFLLFVPALVAAVFAGSLLLTRHRFVSGSLLSVGALVLPALFLLAGRDDASLRSPFQLLASPSIESVAPPRPAVPAKPTPIPTLRGVALPVPVKPTPPPRIIPPI